MTVLTRSLDEGVLLLTLNRPDQGNAWSLELEDAYFGALADAGTDPDVRAVVVTGAGRHFCVGADVSDIENEAAKARSWRMTFPLTVPKPIIAAINGGCAGVGLVQAMLCELRFATPTAKLTTSFARRGMVAEHGSSWILPRLVGPAHAADLLLSGRVVTGAEAAAIGLVNRAVEDPVGEALTYARELVTWSSPTSMAVMKQQLYADMVRDFEEALDVSDRLVEESLERDDLAEGIASYLDKRPPRFAPFP